MEALQSGQQLFAPFAIEPETAVEVLTADFRGVAEHLDIVLDAKPDIFNHNLETVERLQRPIRKTARYERSLWVLKHASERGLVTKSGIMLGIGEKEEENQVLKDIRKPESKSSPLDNTCNPRQTLAYRQMGHLKNSNIGKGRC